MSTTFPVPDKRVPPAPAVLQQRPAGKAAEPDKYVATLVALVSGQRLLADVAALAAFHTRHTDAPQIQQAAQHLVARLVAAGLPGASTVGWSGGGRSGSNVVAIKPAAAPGGRLIVLCAHYDCRMEVLGDATARAPGADDNASGVAAVLEVARLLAPLPLADTIHFVLFSGEEQGLLGSGAYAAQLAAQGATVDRLVNLDMIGVPPTDGSVTVERDTGNATSVNDAASAAFATVMTQAAASHVPSLPVRLGPIYASDYMPFEARGWVTIGAYEGTGNPHYHATSDDVATIDVPYLTAVTQVVVATLAATSLTTTAEATSGVDLFIRDSLVDAGAQPSGTPHWTSPDIWVRHDGSAADQPELGHQQPVVGRVNAVHVRVGNRGTVGVPAGGATVRLYRCSPGTGMLWPTDFVPIGETVVADPVPAGGSARVGPFPWTPTQVGHECLLATVVAAGDGTIADLDLGELNHGLLVRHDNNVGQRNVAPVLSVPGGKTAVPLWIRGASAPADHRLEIDCAALPPGTRTRLRLPPRVVRDAVVDGATTLGRTRRWTTLSVPAGRACTIDTLSLRPRESVQVELLVELASTADHGTVHRVVLGQAVDGRAAGRETVEITALTEAGHRIFGNRRSREVHVVECPWWPTVAARNKQPFASIDEALAHGYDGCAVCLPHLDTG